MAQPKKDPEKYIPSALTVHDLKATHALYDDYAQEWNLRRASYKGARELIALGMLEQHERESKKNYDRRMEDAYGLSYSRSIVDLTAELYGEVDAQLDFFINSNTSLLCQIHPITFKRGDIKNPSVLPLRGLHNL